ncbi:GIY-YIG nuclease family protein [Tsukamurella sp. NPDC003166]|uniref:GIY-YIG nuclease family protein n=1 Tax=Tsukamurella sp. NPDC003166 TaxID=3154444 RepID=UPI0033A1F8F2
MSTRAAVDRWADAEGFRPAVQFKGTKSNIGGQQGVRYSGFYLLIFTNDTYYLGESVDLRSRMGGHMRHWGDEIADVRFLRRTLSKPQLRAAERTLIHGLNRVVPKQCRNTTHASYTSHKNELVDLLDDDEQAAWVADAASFNQNDPSSLKPIAAQQSLKYHTAAKRFRSRPDHARIVSTLRTYLETCIPAPRRTEFHGWNVSTGASGGDRLLCVSVGRMESFVVFKDNHGFINIPAESIGITERRRLRRLHPDVRRVDIRRYDDFGDVAIIHATSLAAIDALLSDEAVQRGAQTLAYSVMRKHPSAYTRYHCPQVVEDVYQADGFTRPAAADEESQIGPNEIVIEADVAAQPLPSEPEPELVESVPDEIPIDWFVNAGPISTHRNTPEDFRANGEWRMANGPRPEVRAQGSRDARR